MAELVYVLDTVAFISGKSFSMTHRFFTIPEVENELKRSSDKRRFDYFVNAGMEIRTPGRQSLDKIEEYSKKTGDVGRLSGVDKSLLALAMEMDAVLVTDDYSLQNLAAELNIKYQSVGESGIKEVIHWEYKCKGCARIWEKRHKNCPVCGLELKTSRKK